MESARRATHFSWLSGSTLAPVSSLWTPDGEHRVEKETAPPDPAAQPIPPPGEPSEADMAAVAQELLSAPIEDVIANHCYGLFELAALHLSVQPPNLEPARTAVDAMGLLVEGLGERLGAHAATLADGLTQLRLAWVRLADGDGPGPRSSEADSDAASAAPPPEAAEAPTAPADEPE